MRMKVLASFISMAMAMPCFAQGQDVFELGGTAYALTDWQTSRDRAPNTQNLLELKPQRIETAIILEGELHGATFRIRGDVQDDRDGDGDLESNLQLLELSKTFNLSDRLSVFGGKRTLAWDTGLSYQPTGFFQRQVNFTDLTDSFGRAEGLPMLGATYFGDGFDITAVYSDDIGQQSDGFNRGLKQWALNVTRSGDNGDLSLVLQQPLDQSIGLGVIGSRSIGADYVIYGSIFGRKGTNRPINQQILSGETPITFDNPIVSLRRNEDRIRPRGLLGLSASLTDTLTLNAEYSFDLRGLNDAEWSSFNSQLYFYESFFLTEDDFLKRKKLFVSLLYLTDTLIEGGARRHYGFLRLANSDVRWGASAFTRIGLEDGSAVIGTEVKRQFNTHVIGIQATGFVGSETSEYGRLPVNTRATAFIRKRF